jgi:hypothetical protein
MTLARTSLGKDEIDADLALLRREVLPRSGTGQGVVAWYLAARGFRAAAALREDVEALRATRPGLAAAWTIGCKNLLDLGLDDEARALGDETVARFPLVAQACAARAMRSAHLLAGDDHRTVRRFARPTDPEGTGPSTSGRSPAGAFTSGAGAFTSDAGGFMSEAGACTNGAGGSVLLADRLIDLVSVGLAIGPDVDEA